jgi:hypothetical protein
MLPIIYPNQDGKVILFDGTVVYLVDIQFSTNGLDHWESKYISEKHLYEQDGVTLLDAHKYIRFKKSGEVVWQQPAKFIGDDGINGDSPEIRVVDDILQWKLTLANEWNDLYDLSTLKGDKGDMGQGWAVNNGGALDTRPACCGTTTNNSCKSCNPNSISTCGLSTYLSLGNHRINANDYVGIQFHSLDGVSWYSTTVDNEGDYVCAWAATTNTGTNALTCNKQGYIVALSSMVSPYISKGRVYACSDGLWTEIMNIVLPTGHVKTSVNDGLEYLENKLDNITLESYDSGIGFNDNIRIKDDGVNQFKIIASAIGDGLDGGSGVIITVDPTDFIGFGLREYVSDTDGLNNVQVFVDDFVGDGLRSYDDSIHEVDGEDRNLARVFVDDIISPTTGTDFTGLETSSDRGVVETDGFDNIYVKEGDCLENDVDGVNVRADELTIAALNRTTLKVLETDSNTLGIQAKHAHKNIANELHGLEKDNDTTGSFSVKLDTIESPQPLIFNVDGEISINSDGVQGKHLNPNTCDNTKGVEILNDKIVVIVDNTSIEFNGSGQLRVVEAYIQSLIDNGVGSLILPGQGTMVGDITFNTSNSSGLISVEVAGAGANDGVVTFTSDVDESALTTFITNVINSIVTEATTYQKLKNILVAGAGITLTPNDLTSKIVIAATATPPTSGTVIPLDGNLADGILTSYARADHKHSVVDGALTIAKTLNLQDELDSKLELNVAYDNAKITNQGLMLRSPGGFWFKLIVTDNGVIGVDRQ